MDSPEWKLTISHCSVPRLNDSEEDFLLCWTSNYLSPSATADKSLWAENFATTHVSAAAHLLRKPTNTLTSGI